MPILPFLSGRIKYLVEHPEEVLLDPSQWKPIPLQAKVHVKKGEELRVFKLRRVPSDVPFQTPRGPLLNGLFGVKKMEQWQPCITLF